MYPDLFFAQVKHCLDNIDLQDTLNIIRRAIKNNKNIFVIGNGGSASIASHFITDLSHSLGYKVKAINILDNVGLITATANDDGFGAIFRNQLDNLAESGDLLIAFSCSGESTNIIHALLYTRSLDMETIFLTGTGGYFIDVDDRITVNSDDPFVIESVFSAICHAIISAIEEDY